MQKELDSRTVQRLKNIVDASAKRGNFDRATKYGLPLAEHLLLVEKDLVAYTKVRNKCLAILPGDGRFMPAIVSDGEFTPEFRHRRDFEGIETRAAKPALESGDDDAIRKMIHYGAIKTNTVLYECLITLKLDKFRLFQGESGDASAIVEVARAFSYFVKMGNKAAIAILENEGLMTPKTRKYAKAFVTLQAAIDKQTPESLKAFLDKYGEKGKYPPPKK
ncbi:Uncharacterised protein [uncultured archaeon]|nr:Uncharacterised protein [uncultured archaeon]